MATQLVRTVPHCGWEHLASVADNAGFKPARSEPNPLSKSALARSQPSPTVHPRVNRRRSVAGRTSASDPN